MLTEDKLFTPRLTVLFVKPVMHIRELWYGSCENIEVCLIYKINFKVE